MKPKYRSFQIEDPNAAAILEMQGAKIAKPRLAGQQDILLLPEPLASDEFFNAHTLPYVNPGKEITTTPPLAPYYEYGNQPVGTQVVHNANRRYAVPSDLPYVYHVNDGPEFGQVYYPGDESEFYPTTGLYVRANQPADGFYKAVDIPYKTEFPLSPADRESFVTRNIPKAGYMQAVDLPYYRFDDQLLVTRTNPKAGFYKPSSIARDYYQFDD